MRYHSPQFWYSGVALVRPATKSSIDGSPISGHALRCRRLWLLVEKRRRSPGRGLKSVGQIARRRDTNYDYLASIELRARGTRKADSCEQIFFGLLGDGLVLQRLVRDEF